MSEPLDTQVNYRHYLSLDRPDSLRLGISGDDEPANAERLALAQRLLEEHGRIEDAAYASAHWSQEPDIAKPFGLELIIKHRGDVLTAVKDAEIRNEVRDHLGYRPGSHFISDEDGQRWEWFDGGPTDPYIQAQIDAALIELRGCIYGVPEQTQLDDIATRWNAYREEIAKMDSQWCDYGDATDEGHALKLDG